MKDIRLYLGGREILFSESPNLLFNFESTDVTNPTVIRNSFTRTIMIDGVPENNQTFNDIYLLGRTQNAALFNPSLRVPFELYSNGDLVQTGYARLDNIIKTGYRVQYEITLFGGIGDLFYGLSYGFDYNDGDVDTEQIKDKKLQLKDLTYYSPYADDDSEFNFTINKTAVYDAWYLLASEEGDQKWNYINFAPAYNGLPDDFDADKVLINVSGYTGGCRVSVPSGATVDGTTYNRQQVITATTIPSAITIDNETYQTVNGYALSELRENLTEWNVRDLRSYLQRPVLRVKGLIQAIIRYAKEKGDYTINLDSDFFNNHNPYYEDAWITLPMLQNLNGEYAEAEYKDSLFVNPYGTNTTGETKNIGGGYVTSMKTTHNVTSSIPATTLRGASITIKFGVNATPISTTTNTNRLDTSCQRGERYNYTGYTSSYNIKLVAYDGEAIVAQSGNYIFMKGSPSDDNEGRQSTSTNNDYHYGFFYNETGTATTGDFTWLTNDMITDGFTISLPDEEIEYTDLKLEINKTIRYSEGFKSAYTGSTSDFYHKLVIDDRAGSACVPWRVNNYKFDVIKSSVIVHPDDDIMKSGQLITKKKLLSQDGTPCDYLLSYCKLFNLWFDKDPVEKVVTIRTRNNYYINNVIDIDDKIDRSKEINVDPIVSENKWLDFNYTQKDRGEFETKYYNVWGTEFGKQKVKTEYNFDNTSKDLLKDNIFVNGADVLEKGKYYTAKVNDTALIPSFMFEWSDFKLFKQGDTGFDSLDEIYIGQPTPTAMYPYTSEGSRYDFYPKLQLHSKNEEAIDGSNILVFFTGMKQTVASGNTKVYYNITDDLPEMYELNGENTCWLYTKTVMNGSTVIANRLLDDNDVPILPEFSRYVMSGDTIKHTWDFGKCNELFVPNLSYGDYSTVFDRFWYEYIADMYDTRARIVKCDVKLDARPDGGWLRKFYYFDDSIWALIKIEDYDITSYDTTTCTFIKVWDINNYKSWRSFS